jgi:alpha-1,2-mannosyltransferase
MIKALNLIKSAPDKPVYAVLFRQEVKFQYPLSSLLKFDLPARLTGAAYDQIAFWLDRICFVCVLAISFVSSKLILRILKHKQFDNSEFYVPSNSWKIYLSICALTLLFYPILHSYILGQIQTILTLLAALAIWCWERNRKIVVGILIGLICLFKPQMGLLFLWGVFRRQWNMVISGGIVICIFTLISIQFYGLNNNLGYLQALAFLSRHGEAFMANQSVNGLMNRLLFNGQNLEFTMTYPPFLPLVYFVSLITSVAILISGLLWNLRKKNPNVVDFCIMILCSTMASPIAWEHHYAILLPIFVVLSPFAVYYYEKRKWSLILLAIGFLCVSQYFDFTKTFADTRFNILQSYLLFGAAIILLFLFKVSSKIEKTSR